MNTEQPLGSISYLFGRLDLVPAVAQVVEACEGVFAIFKAQYSVARKPVQRAHCLDDSSPPDDLPAVSADRLPGLRTLRLKATQGHESAGIPERSHRRSCFSCALSLHHAPDRLRAAMQQQVPLAPAFPRRTHQERLRPGAVFLVRLAPATPRPRLANV